MVESALGQDILSNKQGRIKSSIATLWSLAIIAVFLRFTSHRLSKAGFWYDDWLLVPAIVHTAHHQDSLSHSYGLTISSAVCLSSVLYVRYLEYYNPSSTFTQTLSRLKLYLSDKSWPRPRPVAYLIKEYKVLHARTICLGTLLDSCHVHCQILGFGVLLAPLRACSEG